MYYKIWYNRKSLKIFVFYGKLNKPDTNANQQILAATRGECCSAIHGSTSTRR